MNDTMSKDPRAIAEAMAAANRKPAPSLQYDAKAIYFEEWRRVVEPPFDTDGPEESWKVATSNDAKTATLEVVAVFSEADFRAMCRAHAHAWFGKKLGDASAEQWRVAQAQRDVAAYQITRQLGDKAYIQFDLANGCVRKHECKDGAHDDVVGALKRILGIQ